MGFRRRDDQVNPLGMLAQVLGAGFGTYFEAKGTQDAELKELGNTAIESAKAELATRSAALSDPDTKLGPEARKVQQARVAQLEGVVNADPMAANQLWTQVNQNLPGGMTSAQANLARLLGNQATGDRAFEQGQVKAERNYQTGRDERGYQATANQNKLNRQFEAGQSEQNRDNATDNALLSAKLGQAEQMVGVINDPAATLQEKEQARRSLADMEASDAQVAELGFSKQVGIVNKGAQGARQAGFRSATVLLANEEAQGRLTALQGDAMAYENEVLKPYDFSRRKLSDDMDLAERVGSAAQAGDMSSLAQYSLYLAKPGAYPEQAAALAKAGITGETIQEATRFGQKVRGSTENEMAYKTQLSKATLTQLQGSNQLQGLQILDNYAENFDSVEEFNTFAAANPKLAKQFGPDGANTIRSKVKLREKVWNRDTSTQNLEMMLTGEAPSPEGFDAWKDNFVGEARAAGLKPETAAAMADQAIAGWGREGQQFDAQNLKSDLEVQLMGAQIEDQLLRNTYMPQQVEQDLEASRAQVESARSNTALTRAQIALATAEAAYAPQDAASKQALTDAQLAYKQAQTRAANARAEQLKREPKTKTNEIGADDISASRSVVESQIEAIKTDAPKGCYVPLEGQAQQVFDIKLVAGDLADTDVCQPAKLQIQAKMGVLNQLADQSTKSMLSNVPITVGGQQTRMNLPTYNLAEQVKTDQAEFDKLSVELNPNENGNSQFTQEERSLKERRRYELGVSIRGTLTKFQRSLGPNATMEEAEAAYLAFNQ